MKNNLLLVVLTLFFCSSLNSQSFTSNLLPGEKGIEPMVVEYQNSYYSFELDMKGISGFSANLKRLMHDIEIIKSNKQLVELQRLKVEGTDKSFGPIPPILKVINDKLYLWYFQPDEQRGLVFWSAKIDISTLKLSDKKALLYIKEDDKYLEYYLRISNPNRFTFKQSLQMNLDEFSHFFFTEASPDSSYYLIAWTSGYNKKLFFSVLDKNLNRIRNNVLELPDEKTTISNAGIDKMGNIYFSLFYDRNNKAKAELLINKDSGSEIRTIILPDAEPEGIYAVYDAASEKLLIGGAYKKNGDYLIGVYFQSFTLNDLKGGK